MSDQHKVGKFGTVFARRVELTANDRDLHSSSSSSRVTAALYLDTRLPGERYDQYPGLQVNGIEYHVSVQALIEIYSSGKVRAWLRHWRMRRTGSGAEATPKALSAVRPLLEKLAEDLFADPLWMARTDVELADELYGKAKGEVEDAEKALAQAKDGLIDAYLALGKARERWERIQAGGDPETC